VAQEASVQLIIDPHSSVPPYEQVRLGVIRHIDTGYLNPEDRLPTVRELAKQLGLANNTVAKAYRELEMSGVISTRGRSGTFVASRASAKREDALLLTRQHISNMTNLGIGTAEMIALLKHELERR